MNYVNNKDKGYDVHRVVAVPIPNLSVVDALKNDYVVQESVLEVALTSGFPIGNQSGRMSYKSMVEMHEHQINKDMSINPIIMYMTKTSSETIDLLQLKSIAGTILPESRPGDTME